MKLLDAADVQHGSTGPWGNGHDEDSRECAVTLDLVDACDPDEIQVIANGGDGGVYSVRPFGILANLSQPVNCWRPDDEAWLTKALEAGNELALTRALVTEPVVGSENWVGATGVTQVTATADLAVDTALAWTTWNAQVLDDSDGAILHVSPESVGKLVTGGLLAINADQGVISAFGIPVVVGVGYTGTPKVFITGPIGIKLSSAELAPGDPTLSRRNRVNIIATQVAEIDLAPCTVVRVGPAGTP